MNRINDKKELQHISKIQSQNADTRHLDLQLSTGGVLGLTLSLVRCQLQL